MSNVVEFKGEYTQPPHVAEKELFGCGSCDHGYTFLIRNNGEIVCSACGTVKTRISATGPDVFVEVSELS